MKMTMTKNDRKVVFERMGAGARLQHFKGDTVTATTFTNAVGVKHYIESFTSLGWVADGPFTA